MNKPPVASGLIVVDKPAGITSHDVVAKMRKIVGTRKIGHAGTLDPMATGILVLGVERATKLLGYVMGHDKTYVATVRLGQRTTTDDREGEIVATADAGQLSEQQIRDAFAAQVGRISQRPSAVSAIKVDGQRAYDLVRQGVDVELDAREVDVHSIDISRIDVRLVTDADVSRIDIGRVADADTSSSDVGAATDVDISRIAIGLIADADVPRLDAGRVVDVDIRVRCGAGTYIRAIARDVGAALGVGGHLTALRRTAIGEVDESVALSLEQIAELDDPVAVPLAEAVRRTFPVRTLTADEARELSYGRRISPSGAPDQVYGAISADGEAVALIDGTGKARVVFTPA